MADVTFGINAIDRTRAAFQSVMGGLQRLDNRSKSLKKSLGSVGTTLATALGLNLNSISDFAAEKIAGLTSGISKDELALLDETNRLRSEGFDIADERRKAAMSDEQRLAYLLKNEETTRERLKTLGTGTYEDARKRAAVELSLQQIMQEREDIQRSLAPDMTKLHEEMLKAERAAGGAIAKTTGTLLTAQEQVDAFRAKQGTLMAELASTDEKTDKGMQRRIELFNQLRASHEGLYDAQQRLNEELEAQGALAREVGGTMAASFENAVFSGGKVRDMLRGMAQDLMRLIFQNAVTKPLAGWITGGIMSMFGGGKASGGSVSSGTPYMVGEKGPELFTPSQAGRIIPNHASGGGGGGGGAVVVNQNNTFSSGIQGVQLANMLEQNRRATVAEIQRARQERKLRM